ncbi:hypothetical protein QE152_g27711 [Popillia japonica]|uniref:Uncharacterized protein n=1 Tax=Popillia japonica TaxID=7064 RepID=A0AAW1JTS5_POPJA
MTVERESVRSGVVRVRVAKSSRKRAAGGYRCLRETLPPRSGQFHPERALSATHTRTLVRVHRATGFAPVSRSGFRSFVQSCVECTVQGKKRYQFRLVATSMRDDFSYFCFYLDDVSVRNVKVTDQD